jgi:hypothetical protein
VLLGTVYSWERRTPGKGVLLGTIYSWERCAFGERVRLPRLNGEAGNSRHSQGIGRGTKVEYAMIANCRRHLKT